MGWLALFDLPFSLSFPPPFRLKKRRFRHIYIEEDRSSSVIQHSLLHRTFSSKKGMQKLGLSLSTLTKLFKKELQKHIRGTVKCVTGQFAVKRMKLEKHF